MTVIQYEIMLKWRNNILVKMPFRFCEIQFTKLFIWGRALTKPSLGFPITRPNKIISPSSRRITHFKSSTSIPQTLCCPDQVSGFLWAPICHVRNEFDVLISSQWNHLRKKEHFSSASPATINSVGCSSQQKANMLARINIKQILMMCCSGYV